MCVSNGVLFSEAAKTYFGRGAGDGRLLPQSLLNAGRLVAGDKQQGGVHGQGSQLQRRRTGLGAVRVAVLLAQRLLGRSVLHVWHLRMRDALRFVDFRWRRWRMVGGQRQLHIQQ